MQQQTSRKPQTPNKALGWVSALWSVEAIGIAIGVSIGAIAGFQLAKPSFEGGDLLDGLVYTATAIICSLIPVATVIRLHQITRTNQNPRNPGRKV